MPGEDHKLLEICKVRLKPWLTGPD